MGDGTLVEIGSVVDAVNCALAIQGRADTTITLRIADGVVEDLITGLSRFKSLSVIARNSSFVYKGGPIDVRQAAGELGCRYVVEGSVRRVGQRLRITAQLVDGANAAHLWAQNFDGSVEDVFDVQDRITECVVGPGRAGHAGQAKESAEI